MARSIDSVFTLGPVRCARCDLEILGRVRIGVEATAVRGCELVLDGGIFPEDLEAIGREATAHSGEHEGGVDFLLGDVVIGRLE